MIMEFAGENEPFTKRKFLITSKTPFLSDLRGNPPLPVVKLRHTTKIIRRLNGYKRLKTDRQHGVVNTVGRGS